MSSYPIVLTDEFCIITFSCPPTSVTFDSAPAPGPMKAGKDCSTNDLFEEPIQPRHADRIRRLQDGWHCTVSHRRHRPFLLSPYRTASPDSSSYGKTISAQQKFNGLHVWNSRRTARRIAERDSRDGRDEVGIQSVHVAPFSQVSRFTRHGLWRWRTFPTSC